MSRSDLTSRIFVGGLDPSVIEADLEKAFKMFGDVTNVMVLRDRETGRSRGFAFVSFKDAHSSEDAINRMHGVEIRGRCVSVRHAAKEKNYDDRPRRGSFRGGGRGGYSTRGRSDGPSYGSNGHSGGGTHRGGGGYRDEPERGFPMRDEYKSSGDSYMPRSRSPIDGGRVVYRDDSPPRRQRYSPPPPRREYSPKPAIRESSDYYGGARDYSPPPIRGSRPLRGYSPPVREARYGSSAQPLSPARERNAYISSRARDSSPPQERSDYRMSSDIGGSRSRRAPSPRDSHPARAAPTSRRDYASNSREYGGSSNSKEYGGTGSRDYYSNTSSSREYGSSGARNAYSSASRDYKEPLEDSRGRAGYDARGTDVGSSSRYPNNVDDRYTSKARGGMSPPMRRAPTGGSRTSSRSARDRSPVGRDAPPPRRY